MLLFKYLLTITGWGLLAAAATALLWSFYSRYKRLNELVPVPIEGKPLIKEPVLVPWRPVVRLMIAGVVGLLIGSSITIVPSGVAAVRVNQLTGTAGEVLYPGVHLTLPGIETAEPFNTRDQIYVTAVDSSKGKTVLKVQTREGLTAGLAIAVRYRLDARRLPYMFTNLPQPVEVEMVDPSVAGVFREIAPHYLVREMFATKREQLQREAAAKISSKLKGDGIWVKEVVLRDIQLPADYARGLEGLLVKEQENESMNIDLEIKKKMVRGAELEADAQKAREIKQAEARAQVVVLQAKAQADAMQHTLPLKEKQIQQSRLEAEARKEATVMNADALAQAKVIDSKAELERRKLMNLAEEDKIHRVALADVERLRLESELVKQNPLLIQKIIAEKLSDKVQIMMVPSDGKFFFANDVLKAIPSADMQRR